MPSALSLGGIALASAYEPVNNSFFVCPGHAGFVECKLQWLSELGDLGPCPLGGSVKS